MSIIDQIDNREVFVRVIRHGEPTSVKEQDKMAAKLIELARVGKRMRWVPVSERLPENGQKVDVLIRDLGRSNELFRQTDVKFVGSFPIWVTHWMPLPEPPMTGDIS